jgi:hypothetical protein
MFSCSFSKPHCKPRHHPWRTDVQFSLTANAVLSKGLGENACFDSISLSMILGGAMHGYLATCGAERGDFGVSIAFLYPLLHLSAFQHYERCCKHGCERNNVARSKGRNTEGPHGQERGGLKSWPSEVYKQLQILISILSSFLRLSLVNLPGCLLLQYFLSFYLI